MPEDLQAEIARLRRERRAVILAHTYQAGEIQDLADFVGDSYGLSKQAAGTTAELIVFCGVSFMAETAAVLNPGRRVLMPDPAAGCPMADMIDAASLRALKAKHPGSPVVCYVNSSAEVKAESDVCCTSSNAVKVVRSLPGAGPVIFVPDKYLGLFAQQRAGRPLVLWEGFCPTHARITAAAVARARREHPQAEIMVHPECRPEVQAAADHVLSTGQMCELAAASSCPEFVVGTETGILHTLRKTAPGKTFHALLEEAVCPNMKKTTLAKVRACLRDLTGEVRVPEPAASGARRAIERMLQVVG